MKRLHISFKLSIAAFIAAIITSIIAFAQLLSIYSIVGSNEGNERLAYIASFGKLLNVLIFVFIACHIVCLIWGCIHEYSKKK